jgi:hypothetical protein
VHFDLLPASEEEDGARLQLPEHFEECRSSEAKEAMWGAGGRDAQLACPADSCLPINLNEHLAFEDAENLVGVVVAMEVPDFVSSDGLNLHDETSQAVLGACDDPNIAGSDRERHGSKAE